MDGYAHVCVCVCEYMCVCAQTHTNEQYYYKAERLSETGEDIHNTHIHTDTHTHTHTHVQSVLFPWYCVMLYEFVS